MTTANLPKGRDCGVDVCGWPGKLGGGMLVFTKTVWWAIPPLNTGRPSPGAHKKDH